MIRFQFLLLAASLFGGLGAAHLFTRDMARGPAPILAAPTDVRTVPITADQSRAVPTAPHETPPPIADPSGRLYLWRAANGAHQISSVPPPPGIVATVHEYAVPIVEGAPGRAAAPRFRTADPPRPAVRGLADHPLSVYTPEGFGQLRQEVHRLGTVFETRDKTMSALLHSLQEQEQAGAPREDRQGRR